MAHPEDLATVLSTAAGSRSRLERLRQRETAAALGRVQGRVLGCTTAHVKPDCVSSVLAFVSWTAVVVCVLGCGSSSSTKAGPVLVTEPSGASSTQLTSLVVGSKALVSMAPVLDKTGAGVDWSAVCGGSPVSGSKTGGACGTFAPAHTTDGAASLFTAPATIPIGSSVTIVASPTSDPSASSTATLQIVAAPISISFAGTLATSVAAGGTTTFNVLLANDTTGAGANWTVTCGASAGGCGSFNPGKTASLSATTYTAPNAVPPAGPGGSGTVTVTATSVADPTKSVSAVLTIQAIPLVSVSLTPAVQQVQTNSFADLIASVANDSSGQGVTWSVSCSNAAANACGSFTPTSGLSASGAVMKYNAPTSLPGGSNQVTITAASVAYPAQNASETLTITAAPVFAVSINPPAATALGATQALQASITPNESGLTVAWSVSCGSTQPGGCGTFAGESTTGRISKIQYTAPAAYPPGGTVVVSAVASAASSTVTGNPGLASISITSIPAIAFLQPPPASVTALATAPVSAAVTNDPTASGVTWSVQCGNTTPGACGYILPVQTLSGATATYTAPPVPPGGAVTVTAQSTTDAQVSVVSGPIAIGASAAVSVSFIPAPPTQVQQATSVSLTASVANDSTNAGVDWQVCASGCGFFTITPAIPPPTRTPNLPTVPAVTATTVKGWPNAAPITYTAPDATPPGGALTVIATATATDQAQNPVSIVASVTIAANAAGPALQGRVQAGTQPVGGAQVALYAAGTSGYGSASALLAAPGENPYAITDQNGKFTIPAGYNCPAPSSQVYLVAVGGKVGSGPANQNLALMTALGSCGALTSSPVAVNEVTTIASAWAVAPFAANLLTTGLNSYLNIGASSGNGAGLANAFATVNNLVNLSTGQTLFTVPAGNAAVPYAEIDTLADILNACAVTGGGSAADGSVCGHLFSDANPYRNSPGTQYPGIPTDTLQAAFEIAQNPAYTTNEGISNVAASIDFTDLFTLASTSSPFQPVLATLPLDVSLSLNFTTGSAASSGNGPSFFALDSAGNLWITQAGVNGVGESNNQGAPIAPSGGYTTKSLIAPGPLAIDASGNVWICDQDGLTELNFAGLEVTGSPFAGGGLTNTVCSGLAIDGSGNLWANTSTGVAKFDDLGDPLSPSTGYPIPISPLNSAIVNPLPPIAVDDSGNVWVGIASPANISDLLLAELNNTSGLPNELGFNVDPNVSTNFVNTNAPLSETQIAADGSENVWIPTAPSATDGGASKVPPYGGNGTTDVAGGFSHASGPDPFVASNGVAIDGANVVWIGDGGGTPGASLPVPPNLGGYNPQFPNLPFGYVSPSLAAGPLSVAVDGSGNVWVLLANNTVTEFIGVATPAVAPLAAAVKNKKLGAKP
jgi:hypothetical protein